jgi:hypothetical protein
MEELVYLEKEEDRVLQYPPSSRAPGFVEDRQQMCFSRGSPSCFFLHMRVLREEGNRGGKRSKRENNNDRHPTLGLFFHSSYDSSTSSFN